MIVKLFVAEKLVGCAVILRPLLVGRYGTLKVCALNHKTQEPVAFIRCKSTSKVITRF